MVVVCLHFGTHMVSHPGNIMRLYGNTTTYECARGSSQTLKHTSTGIRPLSIGSRVGYGASEEGGESNMDYAGEKGEIKSRP